MNTWLFTACVEEIADYRGTAKGLMNSTSQLKSGAFEEIQPIKISHLAL